MSSNKCTAINDIVKYVIKKNKVNLRLNFKTKKIIKWKSKKSSFIAADEIYKNL